MNRLSVRFIAESAIIAALYVVLTWLLAPISYGAIQFRLSEVLILLVVFKPKYAFALIVGCLIANIPSSLGWYDIMFGTLASVIAILPMTKIKSLSKAAILPVISNAIIISLELGIVFDMFSPIAFWFNVLTIALGEAVVLYLVGIPIMYSIAKNEALVEMLSLDATSVSKSNKLTLQQALSIALGVIGIVLYAAYPFMENIKAIDLFNENYWTILFAIIPICYTTLFILLKGKLGLIFTGLITISLLIPYILLGVEYPSTLSYPYYYGYLVYIVLLIILLVFNYNNSVSNYEAK